ncbi:MAG: hypothetical protein AB1458_06495 [Bacteroidota bacterium]
MKKVILHRKRSITTALAGFAVLCFAFTSYQTKPKLPLDTKTYVVEVLQDGKSKPICPDDELKFNTGKFKSVLFMDWGFSNSPYNCTVIDSTSEKKIYTFDCETKPNDKGEIMIWSGTVTGEDIEGTAELQRKGKTVKTYTFSGTLKAKPGSKKK